MNPCRLEKYRRIIARAIEAGVSEREIARVINRHRDIGCDPYTLTVELDALVPGGEFVPFGVKAS